jgi:rubrerythrin
VNSGSSIRSYEPGDYVDFAVAGEEAAGAFRCAECGYGVTVQRRLPLCPMCGGTAWEHAEWLPFMRSRQRPLQ